MSRNCSECQEWVSYSGFSRNQWDKGDGYSRCRGCVNGYSSYPTYECSQCGRGFNNANELNMHMQVHRPTTVACPVCGDQRFKSGANAVQHVESGYCTGCLGKDNARKKIYEFACKQGGMTPYMADRPQLTYGEWQSSNEVPDNAYKCPDCVKSFRHLSQLLQHNDQKHGRTRLIGN